MLCFFVFFVCTERALHDTTTSTRTPHHLRIRKTNASQHVARQRSRPGTIPSNSRIIQCPNISNNRNDRAPKRRLHRTLWYMPALHCFAIGTDANETMHTANSSCSRRPNAIKSNSRETFDTTNRTIAIASAASSWVELGSWCEGIIGLWRHVVSFIIRACNPFGRCDFAQVHSANSRHKWIWCKYY